MPTVTSKDGTTIAYEKKGNGPAIIIVLGALSIGTSGATKELTDLLASQFTVYNYDRRGRGKSSDVKPYAVEREIEDLEALIDEPGGSAYLYSHSSGGGLALQAAEKLKDKVKKLALYEVPYNDDIQAQSRWKTYGNNLANAVAKDDGGEAAVLFLKLVGISDEQLKNMQQSPAWKYHETVGTSLAYDFAVMGETGVVPVAIAAHVICPVLVLYGGASFPFMAVTATTLGAALPNAEVQAIEGQEHNVDQKVLAPLLTQFFAT